MAANTDWPDYIERFHRERPGVTEALLARSFDLGHDTPYTWLTEPLSRTGSAVDLGCGSGPTASGFASWVGLDLSLAELRAAQSRGRGCVVHARAEAVPFATGSAAVVIAAMSLMVTDNAAVVLAEANRVLRSEGTIALLLPAQRPLTWGDRFRYGALLVALGRAAVPFPHPEVERDIARLLSDAGFDLVADETRRFGYSTGTPARAQLFIDSLYLPGVAPARIRLADRVARSWGTVQLGVPLRRVIARKRRSAG